MARHFLWLFIIWGLVGCIGSAETPSARIVTATPEAHDALTAATIEEELPPLTMRRQNADVTATPVLAATSMPEACSLESVENTRTQYTITAVLNWASQQVTVEEQIRYTT